MLGVMLDDLSVDGGFAARVSIIEDMDARHRDESIQIVIACFLIPALERGAEFGSSHRSFTEPMTVGGHRIPKPGREIGKDATG